MFFLQKLRGFEATHNSYKPFKRWDFDKVQDFIKEIKDYLRKDKLKLAIIN